MVPTQELEVLIRARYTLIEIISWEEERVQECLSAVAAEVGKQLCCWSASRGLYFPQGVESKPGPTTEIKTALREIEQQRRPMIYLFFDACPWLDKDPLAVRKLKELSLSFKASPKSIVLLNSSHRLPEELEKEVTVVDFPLPDREDLGRLLDSVQAELGGLHFPLSAKNREELVQAALGLTWREAENALARALIVQGKLSAAAVPFVLEEKKQNIKKGGLLEYLEPSDDFERVGGLAGLKDWVRKRSLAFSQRARDFGLPAPRGILLLGVQGCGKSLCAKALSALWRLPILRLDVGRMFSSLMGSSEDNMRRAIKLAESTSPCILWIDEIEKAFAGTRGSESDGGTSARILATFLTWLQEKKECVFVVATANDVTSLPPELLRKGRLDEIFFVDLPSAAERADILAIHLRSRHRDPARFDLQGVARLCEGFSGSEIEQVVISALYEAFDRGGDLDNADLVQVIGQTVPLSRTRREEIQGLREWARTRARSAS